MPLRSLQVNWNGYVAGKDEKLKQHKKLRSRLPTGALRAQRSADSIVAYRKNYGVDTAMADYDDLLSRHTKQSTNTYLLKSRKRRRLALVLILKELEASPFSTITTAATTTPQEAPVAFYVCMMVFAKGRCCTQRLKKKQMPTNCLRASNARLRHDRCRHCSSSFLRRLTSSIEAATVADRP